jgi:hypothetical protein
MLQHLTRRVAKQPRSLSAIAVAAHKDDICGQTVRNCDNLLRRMSVAAHNVCADLCADILDQLTQLQFNPAA